MFNTDSSDDRYMMNVTNKQLATVATLALGMLYAGQNPGVKLTSQVYELEGCTIIVAHKELVVRNAVGATVRIGL